MESQKNKAGRPPKPECERLTKQVNIRITQSTFNALVSKAITQKEKHQDIARKAIESALHP